MKPFTALPIKVLASLLAVAALVVGFAWSFPRWAVFLAFTGTVVTLAGASLVAWEARSRRKGQRTGPLPEPLRPAAWAWALTAAVLVFLCAPDLTVKDSGEIGAAAHVLGVPHPTGFPLYCMLAKAFDLLPVGAVFFRVTLVSALGMAMAAALAAGLAGLSCAPRWIVAAASASLLAAAGPWLHATTIEVYALSAGGLGATVVLAALAAVRQDARLLALSAFFCGLGAGGHVTWPIEGLVFLSFCAFALARRLGARVLAGAVCGLALGAVVIAYLPVAAARDPVLNWGDPSSWEGLFAHLSGERIRRSFAGEIGVPSPAFLWTRATLLGRVLWESSGLVWPLALAGAVVLGCRLPAVGMGLLALAATDVVFALLVNPMGLYDLQTSVPTFFVVGALAGAGALWLWSRAATAQARVLVGSLVAACLAAQFATAPAERDLRHVSVPRRAVSPLLDGAPLLSSVLTSSDDLSAAMIAVQAVEGARPDLLVLVRPHLADAREVARRARASQAHPADEDLLGVVTKASYPTDPTQAEAALMPFLAQRGPIFVEVGDAESDRALRPRLLPGFPAYRLLAEAPPREAVLQAAKVAQERAMALRSSAERWGRSFLGAWVRLLGVHLALIGLDREALEVTEAALGLDAGDARIWHNLGVLHAAMGDLTRALPCLERAVRLDPGYVRAWRALARHARPAGRADIEALARERLRSLAPSGDAEGEPQ